MANVEEEEELVFGQPEWAGESGEQFSGELFKWAWHGSKSRPNTRRTHSRPNAEHGFACFGSYWCWS